MNNVRSLSDISSSLGEGICISLDQAVVAWVDIHTNRLIRHDLVNHTTSIYLTSNIPSTVFYCDQNYCEILTDKGIEKLDFNTGDSILLADFAQLGLVMPPNFRTNDGVKIGEGQYFFGTMHSSNPGEHSGNLYFYDGVRLHNFESSHIPNGFIIVGEKLLVADSWEKRILEYHSETLELRGTWSDLSSLGLTPDGGFLSRCGHVMIALWDDSAIGVFDDNGRLQKKIDLPIKRPTNCVQKGEDLIVTSSKLDETQSLKPERSTLDGKTLSIEKIF